MKTQLLILFLISGFGIKAQNTFSLTELQKICNYNLSDFDTYVLSKGYSFWDKSDSVNQYYLCDVGTIGFKNDISISKKQPNNPIVVFGTYDKKYYINMKELLSTSGYKLVETLFKEINQINTPVYRYSNGKYTVMLTTGLDLNDKTKYTVLICKK